MKDLNFLLERKHIDFKPAHAYKRGGSVYCGILAYKDARTDMDILDDCVGSMMWQNEYKRDSAGILQCGIGIYDGDSIGSHSEWIWKWSNGVPSDFEKEKGEYSDAFKRAGFMWGIGRCLYEFPRIEIQLNDKEYHMDGDKVKVNTWFRPNDFHWDVKGEIGDLHVRCAQKFGNTWVTRFDNKPNK